MKDKRNVIYASDYILESSGVACGDKLSLYIIKENNKIYFKYLCDSCNVSKQVALYIEKRLSGKNETYIYKELLRLINKEYLKEEKWIKELGENRSTCIQTPLSLLKKIFNQNDAFENKNSKNILACDACVQMRKMNWDRNRIIVKEKRKSFKEIVNELKKNSIQEDEFLQKFGLAVLSDNEIKEFSKLMENITIMQEKKIKKLRLASPYLNNTIKYNLILNKSVETLVYKQILSMKIADEEIKIIQKYIDSNNLKIDSVKGQKTAEFYPEKMYRTHMDYDYLSENYDDAFKFIDYLINKRNFKLVIGGSVPFSFKNVLDGDKKEVLTAHIHLEKILQDKFQVIVDINMGGFPLGRTGIIKCNTLGKIELEDLICITLSHLFKHEYAFIKDVNDLYYLLNSKKVNKMSLMKKIKKYNLENLFYIAYYFLKEKMKLDEEYDIEGNEQILKVSKQGWPYSVEKHFIIKFLDMLELNQKQFGLVEGIKETKRQIYKFASEGIKSNYYYDICPILNERVYLYPVVFFKKYKNIDYKNLNDFKIIDNILIFKKIIILPIGLFITHNNKQDIVKREEIEKEIIYVLKALNIRDEECNYNYIMEARKDTWLY